MDLATHGTSTKKHNLCCAFSFWKIFGALEKLTLAQKQLRLKVEMITGKRSEDMHPTKLTWLAETKNLLLQVEILKTEMSDAKQFLIWKHRRGLGDKFDKMTMDIRKKLEDADKLDVEPVAGAVGHTDQQKDDQESSSSSSSSSSSLLKNCYILLKSARQAAFEIIEAFQDNDVKLIGLVGMGCMGKTDLAILMGINAKESGMFDAVIKVSGRSLEGFRPNLGAIRFEIAKALDPKLSAKEIEKDGSIANELIGGLMKKVEKILIILDDVWEVTDLKAFVISLGKDHKGCKILLTTRLRHVCQDFGCQKIIHLKEIDNILELEPYRSPVQSVELGSNPFVTFHRSMEKEEIDGRLMLNCDYLNDMKSFFKLCSHFPREYAPTVEELTRYGIGQGLFNDYESIESARKKTHSIVSTFRSSLMVEEEEYCVRMCDSFCKLPVFQNKLPDKKSQKHSNYQLQKLEIRTIVFLKTSKFPWNKFFNLKFKNLQTLTIIEDDDRANFYKDRNFGGGSHIVKLNVLCLQAGCFPSGDWAENPPTLSLEGIENFEGLHVLQVKGYKVKGVSSLVKLNKLEILGFIGCTFEDKLPEGLKELQNLKILDFSYCVELHEQPQKWILKLSKLEELYITDVSLEVWSRSGFLQQLQKLNSYLSLIVLLQEVKSTFCPQQFVVPRFPRYRIELTNINDGLFSSLKNKGGAREEKEEEVDHFAHFKSISSSKALRIRALSISPFEELFKDVEYLHLINAKDCHNIVPSLDEGGLSGLQDLQLHHCENLEYLINKEVIGGDLVQVCPFSKLTNLELVGLAKLESLWNGGGHMINLGNLKSFRLRDCHNLRGYIFPKSIAQSLAQLEIVEVSNCSDRLKAVFEQCTVDGLVCLPKLATVKISMLYDLQYVFPSYVTERFPQLTELQVSHCRFLKHIFISSNNEVNEKNDLDHCCHELPQLRCLVLQQLECLKTLCGGKDIIFAPLLEELQVHNCPNLQPFTLTLNNDTLPRLKKLCLGIDSRFCVLETDAVKVYTKMNKWSTSRPLFIVGTRPFDSLGTCFLSNLKELELGIADLKVLWKDSTIIGLHNLTHLSLNGCLRLEYVFTPLSVHNVPNLKSLRIETCDELGQIVAEDETTTEAHGQQHRPIWFPNLSDIYISWCLKLSNVFPARLADQLPKLKRLRVETGVPSLTQIFGPDRDSKETSNSKVVQLPLLQNLILKGLRNMVRFAPEGLHFTFPALNHLEVRDCTKMQTIFYAAQYQGVCAITEKVMDYTQPMNAAVAVPIFSGDNYRGWRNKMITYFKSQDLWEVVALRIKAPLRDAQALFVIQNAVLDPIYSKIIGATSARDAWLTLEKIYLNAIDPYILKPFSGNEQEAKRWTNAKRLEMDADNNVLWPDGGTASEHETPVIVDLRDPDGLRALDLI